LLTSPISSLKLLRLYLNNLDFRERNDEMLLSSARKGRKGQAMVEYALLVCCIAVVCAVATSMLGEKTAEALGVAAAIMPGAHADDNAPIAVGPMIPKTIGPNGAIVLNSAALVHTDRFAPVLGVGGAALLVTDTDVPPATP
jgi:Flp pilus assembly pilin Flp